MTLCLRRGNIQPPEGKQRKNNGGKRKIVELEIVYQVVARNDKIVTKRRVFKTQAALERFALRLVDQDNFVGVLAYAGN